MSTFKEDFIKNIIYFNTKNDLKRESYNSDLTSPRYDVLSLLGNAHFNEFSSIENMGFIKNIFTESIPISKSMFESIRNTIQLFSLALTKTSLINISNYYKNTLRYTNICKRLISDNTNIMNHVNELSNNSLRYIDIHSDCNAEKTTTFTIGNFITLPFVINNTNIYNNNILLLAYTQDTIVLDNLSLINTLPLEFPALVKISSDNTLNAHNTISVNCAISPYVTNLIYIRTYGDVLSIKLTLLHNNGIVYQDTKELKEAIFNFDPITIDALLFEITLANYNKTKNISLEIAELSILNNIKFSKSAAFQSEKVPLNNYLDINTIGINADDSSNNDYVNFDIYSSVTFNKDSDILDYFNVDKLTGVTFPLTKYTHSKGVKLNSSTIQDSNIVNVKSKYSSSTDVSAILYKFKTQDINIMNFKTAKLFIGLPKTYGMLSSSPKESNSMYENWTKIDNFYRTYIINNEEGVTLDIGNSQIKINNQIVSGIINMPIGISVIDVHQSLFDITLGNNIDKSAYETAFNTDEYIFSDQLYPNNFIYKLAGLPTFDSNGVLKTENQITDRAIEGLAIIDLGTPFLPYSVKISSSNIEYELHLAKTPSMPGTFTIEPYSGKIKIFSYNNTGIDNVNITWQPASSLIRPCGMLFNRLATYIDFKAISNMMATLGVFDNTFFSFVSLSNEKNILIPMVSFESPINEIDKAFYYILSYNTYEDNNIYVSTKINLKTTNSNLTPILNNLYIKGIT